MKKVIQSKVGLKYRECERFLSINFGRESLLKGKSVYGIKNIEKYMIPLIVVFILLSLDIVDRNIFYSIVTKIVIALSLLFIGVLLLLEVRYRLIYKKYYKNKSIEEQFIFEENVISIIESGNILHTTTWDNVVAIFLIDDSIVLSFNDFKLPGIIPKTPELEVEISEFLSEIDKDYLIKHLESKKGKVWTVGIVPKGKRKKYILFLLLVSFFVASGIYVEFKCIDESTNVIPSKARVYDLNLEYEVYEKELFYLNTVPYYNTSNKLMIRNIENGKVSESGIEDVDTFKLGGKYIYAQCNEKELCLFDLEKERIGKHLEFFPLDTVYEIDSNDHADIQLMCADSKGAYFVIDDNKSIGIFQISPKGKITKITVLHDMAGDIDRMTAYGDYLIFGYNDADLLKHGTYIYDFGAHDVEKVSDIVGEEDIERFKPFIWDDNYVIPIDNELHLISLESREKKTINLIYYSCNIYLEGDWLYDGSGPIVKYNLRTGEVKTYKDYDRCLGTLKVIDGKIYDGYIVENADKSYSPVIILKKLKSNKWKESEFNLL